MYRAKNKFSGGALTFTNLFKEYLTFENFSERFEFSPPPMSVHNLIIGQPYIDSGNRGYVRNIKCPKS